MKKAVIIVFLVSISLALSAAGILQRIVLLDDSVIVGEVIELKDGVYTVRSETVGEIKVAVDKVLEITRLDGASSSHSEYQETSEVPVSAGNIDIIDRGAKKTTRSARKPADQETRTMAGSDNLQAQQDRANAEVQSMMMQDDFLDSMMDLSGSQNMMDVMSDPEVMDAISRNDYEFLMNNEKMKNLMESSEIRDILGE